MVMTVPHALQATLDRADRLFPLGSAVTVVGPKFARRIKLSSDGPHLKIMLVSAQMPDAAESNVCVDTSGAIPACTYQGLRSEIDLMERYDAASVDACCVTTQCQCGHLLSTHMYVCRQYHISTTPLTSRQHHTVDHVHA